MSVPKKKRWLSSLLRWGIAIVGIAYVLWNMRFHDRVRIINEQGELGEVLVWNDANDAGLLQVRSRPFDIAVLAVGGIAIIALSIVVPPSR